MPKISVIIPVYNVEMYLNECLDSVLNQTFQDFEIICINDESTDNSLTILEEYLKKDSRITVINQKHSGAGSARNKGLSVANGDYLAFIDGDDFYDNKFLEKMYQKALLTDADIVICKVKSFDMLTKKTKIIENSLKEKNLPKDDVFNVYLMPNKIFNTFQNWNTNKLFKHSFISENHIKFQNLFRTNDLFFTCSALVLAKRITTIKECLMTYRIGLNQNSQSTNYLYPKDFYKAFVELKKFLVEISLFELVKKSFKEHFYRGCVYNLNSITIPQIKNELFEFLSTKFQEENLNINEELKPYNYGKKNGLEYIFSIKNSNNKQHKILTICGLKIKLRRLIYE